MVRAGAGGGAAGFFGSAGAAIAIADRTSPGPLPAICGSAMPMLACTHHVTWIAPAEGGKHQCLYCREFVTKKDIFPKWDDLGPDFQKRWDAHEKGETAAAAPKPA